MLLKATITSTWYYNKVFITLTQFRESSGATFESESRFKKTCIRIASKNRFSLFDCKQDQLLAQVSVKPLREFRFELQLVQKIMDVHAFEFRFYFWSSIFIRNLGYPLTSYFNFVLP